MKLRIKKLLFNLKVKKKYLNIVYCITNMCTVFLCFENDKTSQEGVVFNLVC